MGLHQQSQSSTSPISGAPFGDLIPLAAALEAIRSANLLTPDQLRATADLVSRRHVPDARALTNHLTGQGWLTRFQAETVVYGFGHELVINSYVVLDRLGQGGTGDVFKARHRLMDRTAAIKIIRRDLLGDTSVVKRFYREMEVVGRMTHPHIVEAYDAGPVKTTHFIAMELVDGVDLHTYVVRHGPLAQQAACRYLKQAASALGFVHGHGLVHRDVKPANIMWAEKTGSVKLLDLGLARLARPDRPGQSVVTQQGVLLGTLNFIAPEQLDDGQQADARADLYSLGATWYFLLTGRSPVPDGSMFQKVVAVMNQEPTPAEQVRPGLSPRLVAVVRRLMAKSPAARFQTADELLAALDGVDGADERLFAPAAPIPAAPVPAAAESTTVIEDGAGNSPLTFVETKPAPGLNPPAGPATSRIVPAAAARPLPRDHRRLILGAGGALVVGVVGIWGCLYSLSRPGPGPAKVAATAPETAPARDTPPAEDKYRRWVEAARKMTASRQLEEVTDRLRDDNPEFKGALGEIKFDHGVIRGAEIPTEHITDLRALAGFGQLRHLILRGPNTNSPHTYRSKLTNLGPLEDLAFLEKLVCEWNPVRDLSPLKRMNLTLAHVNWTEVDALDVFEPMARLEEIACADTAVTSLAPLRGHQSLRFVSLKGCGGISDISPLAGLPLKGIDIRGTAVTDFRLVSACPDLIDFFCSGPGITSLEPLRGLPALVRVEAEQTGVTDLSPLAGSKTLQHLGLVRSRVADLAPLKALPLVALYIDDTPVTSLDGFRGNAVRGLSMTGCTVNDLSPLQTLPRLEHLRLTLRTKRDVEVLRGMTGLKMVNNLAAKEALDNWKP